MVIDAKCGIDVELIRNDLLVTSVFAPKCPDSKLSIIIVCKSIRSSIGILLEILTFDVLLWATAYLLLEHLLKSYKAVHFDVVFAVTLAANRNDSGGIIGYGAADNGIARINGFDFQQILENALIIFEL